MRPGTDNFPDDARQSSIADGSLATHMQCQSFHRPRISPTLSRFYSA